MSEKEIPEVSTKPSKLRLIRIGSIIWTVFYFRRAQRDSAKKTLKSGLNDHVVAAQNEKNLHPVT